MHGPLIIILISAAILTGCSVPSGGFWAQTDRASNRDVRAVKAQCKADSLDFCDCMINNGYSWQNAINRQCPFPDQMD